MAAEIPTDDSVVERDAIDAGLFWHEHKRKILLWTATVLVLGGSSLAWYVSSTMNNLAAQEALAVAKDAAAYESLIGKYPGTMPAADAGLLLASVLRDAGKIEESTAAFRSFLKSFPEHPLAGGALLGVGQNQAAVGKTSEAAETFQQVAEKYSKSYAAPFARYAQAEILLREFHRQEAKPLLESIQTEFPDSVVARLAAAQLARIGSASAK
jgi:TolA-binding protein